MYISIPIPYPIEKIRYYPYTYRITVRIPYQNGDEYGQYLWGGSIYRLKINLRLEAFWFLLFFNRA